MSYICMLLKTMQLLCEIPLKLFFSEIPADFSGGFIEVDIDIPIYVQYADDADYDRDVLLRHACQVVHPFPCRESVYPLGIRIRLRCYILGISDAECKNLTRCI